MAIDVVGLTKRYGSTLAVNNISFTVPAACVVGFLGPNGAGKTTTMRLLAGYLQPDGGTARINGFDIATQSLDVRRTLGYLPENNPLYPDLYVRELLSFWGSVHGLKGAALRQRIEAVIDMTGLGDFAKKPVGALSKGYRQRVGLASALLHDPATLILDEPTTGLDPNQVQEIRALIRQLGTAKTILFSSHILQEVEAVASHIILIDKGEIKLDAPLQELRRQRTGSTVLRVQFEKPGFDPTLLRSEAGVLDASMTDETHCTLRCAPDADLRKRVYEESLRQGNPILNLGTEQENLEAIFRQLTGAQSS
jgi:ABC-2 type transport system ATP-binding protein